ncbi:MAG: hypothetical protein ABIJ86_13260 [Spirochaetota bacterium]
MTSIHEAEPVAPEPVHPKDAERLHRDEKTPETLPEAPPVETDTGKILDTYA